MPEELTQQCPCSDRTLKPVPAHFNRDVRRNFFLHVPHDTTSAGRCSQTPGQGNPFLPKPDLTLLRHSYSSSKDLYNSLALLPRQVLI